MKKTLLLFAASLACAANLFAESPYGLTVCGVEVNDENKGDIMADIAKNWNQSEFTFSGTMSFDSETKTLNIKDVTIKDYPNAYTIQITEAVTINQEGNNELSSNSSDIQSIIYTSEANLTITGSGTLSLKTPNIWHALFGQYDNDPIHTLTIDHTTIEIQDKGGLSTSGNVKSKLVINESNVKAKMIETWGEIELINCAIVQPSGVYMIKDWCSIMCGEDYATDIVIVPDTRAEAELSWEDKSLDCSPYYFIDNNGLTLANPHNLSVTYASSNTDVVTIDATTGKITLVGPGVTYISASYAGDETYKAANARYCIILSWAWFNAPNHWFNPSSYTAKVGEDFEEPQAKNPFNQTITYTSSDESIATVDATTGEVTPVSEGNCTITANFAENSLVTSGSVSYYLTVEAAEVVGLQQMESLTQNRRAYNLNGQTVKGNQKGIVLMNGQCRFVK